MKITALTTLAIGLLVVPLAAEAPQAGKVYRIGTLSARGRALGTDLDSERWRR